MRFYDSISAAVKNLEAWPSNLREEKSSISFYQTLLNNIDSLKIPDSVQQAIQCILFIPASNADSERSFSAASRFTRGERSNLATETLDNLMRVQRDGSSVLTVKPGTLARQWMSPLPSLKPQNHMPSTLERSDSFMKDVKQSIMNDDPRTLVELHVTHLMTIHGLSGRQDAEEIHQSRKALGTSKATIFSSGAFYEDVRDNSKQ